MGVKGWSGSMVLVMMGWLLSFVVLVGAVPSGNGWEITQLAIIMQQPTKHRIRNRKSLANRGKVSENDGE